MAKQKETGNDLLEAAWTEARRIERETGGTLRVCSYPTSRKGVWLYRAQLCDTVDKRLAGVRVQVDLEYPTAQVTTMGGFWFRLMLHLQREIDTIAPNGMHT